MLIEDRIQASFGRRRGRKLGPEVAHTYEALYPKLSIKQDAKIASIKELFDHPITQVWMEIGFGGGEHLREQLINNPEVGMIGCEPYMNGMARLLFNLGVGLSDRLRVWQDDVRFLIRKLPKGQLTRIYVLFPDPWHKKRHNERRLVNAEFVETLEGLLQSGGEIRLATDDHDYAMQMLESFNKNSKFEKIMGPDCDEALNWPKRPEDWPRTKYESRAILHGKTCAYFIFQKK